MTSATDVSEQPQSAAAPSPFPPIADYAFLSNCHTGALVAPDGAIDWLCVPRFDSPSVFGTLLDRQAGHFRLAPFAANVPAARAYEPGTNTLVTTWQVPTGWIVVRDALTLGPRRIEDRITPHTRPPFDDDADHLLVRTVECIEGSVEIDLVCEPVFDYGRVAAEWTLVGDDRHAADAQGAGVTLRLATDMLLGIEGDRVRGAPAAQAGRAGVLLALVGRGARVAGRRGRGRPPASRRRRAFWRSWVGRARIPDHRWREPIQRSALAIKGLTYMPTGATVAALTTSLPETPGGERNWDYRYTWIRDSTFTLQALHWLEPRLGGRRVHAVRRRPRARRRRLAADHVRDRRPARPDRVDASTSSPATRARARCGSATARSTSARTTSTAPRSTRSCCTRAAASGSRGGCGRSWRPRPRTPRASGASPTRASGRRAARRSTTSPRS